MKTAVVVSDTHSYRRGLDELNGIFAESDYIIHLGDTSADGRYLATEFPEKTVIINGNCDPIKLGADEKVLTIENVKIFACHGHRYSVKSTLTRLASRAKELGCSIALYGHTHCAREDVIDGITLLNPGCGTRYAARSYIYLVINGDKVTYKIVTAGKNL